MSVVLLILGMVSNGGAQEPTPFKPGKLPKDEQAALVSGLTAEFFAVENDAQPIDVKRVRLAAYFNPTDQLPTPFMAPRSYLLHLTGYLKAPVRSEYTFKIHVQGKGLLRINGKDVIRAENGDKETAPIELARGFNKIEVRYQPPTKGDALLRVYWSGEGFTSEPLPPDTLFTRGDEKRLAVHTKVREGRMFFAMHDCSRCHMLPDEVVKSRVAMPELAHQAPSLEGAPIRYGRDWLAKWILNPRDLRPKATMPAVLHGEQAAQDARDLAAYLTSLPVDRNVPKVPKVPKGDVAQGEKLYRNLGCLACHHFGDPKEDTELDLYPLHYVGAKYNRESLAAFLLAPGKHYPWVRMPDFKLTANEAVNLVAYLLDQAKGTVEPAAAGNAERGAKRFTEVGCANCHVLKTGTVPSGKLQMFPPPAAANKGCLANQASDKAPNYGFKKNKLEALRAFIAEGPGSLKIDTPSEFSQRQITNLKCNACHRRDGATSRWYTVLEEEGTLPEGLPILSWTGEKLHPDWARKLIAGEQDHRARPWLKARMPAFPMRAAGIALGLSHEHGFAPDEDNKPAPNADFVEVGKKLIPQMGGLNCIQCHGIGQQPPVAPFEAPGINLLDAAYRIRYDYYQRWMLDPPRVDVTTKMPKLAMDGKTTGIREIYDGDARRQFDALWQFIQTLPALELKK
jgi:cytochrome c2